MDNTTTIWVCVDCMLHHANGECGSCYDDVHGHEEEPWSRLDDDESVAMGMLWEEHTDECNNAASEGRDECDCETDTYSTSQCEGCGSWLHGERHAFTLWFPAPAGDSEEPRWEGDGTHPF